MKRMLFNATHPEELRVAIVDGQKLLDLDIESTVRHQKKGNIYKGVVTRVEPSLEAAFVDYGAERQGFLPLKEISRSYFTDYSASTPMAQVRIQDVIKEDQELLLQVEKDERGNKGAALTTFISLAGRFLVLMPNNPKGGGISRRIEGEERAELRDAMAQLTAPPEHALIARTAGIGKTLQDLQWDLDYLLQLWKAIDNAAKERSAPFLVYQESNLVVRAIRDYLRSDIAEIIVDDPQIHERATKFMQQVMPQNLVKLKLYQDSVPLFSRFQIEHQIEAAFSRDVRLSSGGAVVIDPTEAVVTIDVNSARATKGADIEETALQTNLEAVDEIARQLRIRDIGGLIVIDLIDMTSTRNQRMVESRLQDALKADRARVQVGRISRFGLLEMSRQRLRSSIGEANYMACPRCGGAGHIRAVPSSALSILRILEEEALKENTEAIHAHLPISTATFLLNEKRHELSMIERRLATRIVIIPTGELETPHFRIRRLRSEDLAEEPEPLSYQVEMEAEESEEYAPGMPRAAAAAQQPAIGYEQMTAPPLPEPPKAPSLLRRLFSAFTSAEEPAPEKPQPQPERPASSRPRRRPQSSRRPHRGGREDARRPARSTRGKSGERRPATTGDEERKGKERAEGADAGRQPKSRGGRRGRPARRGNGGGRPPAGRSRSTPESGEAQKPGSGAAAGAASPGADDPRAAGGAGGVDPAPERGARSPADETAPSAARPEPGNEGGRLETAGPASTPASPLGGAPADSAKRSQADGVEAGAAHVDEEPREKYERESQELQP